MSFITSTARCSAESLPRASHLAFFLRHLDGVAWTARFREIEWIDRILLIPGWLNTQHAALFALHADGSVNRNAVQPGEEERVPFERMQGLVGVQKRMQPGSERFQNLQVRRVNTPRNRCARSCGCAIPDEFG
jgi:hypothetical protein